ncbi:MAG: EF-hand domain-containing protein [Phycisphaerales bacterium]
MHRARPLAAIALSLLVASVASAQTGAGAPNPPGGRPAGGAAGGAAAPTQPPPPPGGPGGPGGAGRGPIDPAQLIERIMESDTNKDGKLSKEEMSGPLGERIFERADTNHDGFIDREELVVFAKVEVESRAAGREGGRGGARGGQPATFEGGMKQAGRAFNALKKSAFDRASRTGDLEAVQGLQSGLLAAKGQVSTVPMSEKAKAKFGSDKAAYETDFRRQLLKALGDAMALEVALLDDKSDAARAAFGRVVQAQDAGHLLFQEAEGDDDGGRPERPAGDGRRPGQNTGQPGK